MQKLKTEIKPKPESSLKPLEPYKSPRDQTRDKVFNEILYHQKTRNSGGINPYLTDKQSLDVILPRIHANAGRRFDFESTSRDSYKKTY